MTASTCPGPHLMLSSCATMACWKTVHLERSFLRQSTRCQQSSSRQLQTCTCIWCSIQMLLTCKDSAAGTHFRKHLISTRCVKENACLHCRDGTACCIKFVEFQASPAPVALGSRLAGCTITSVNPTLEQTSVAIACAACACWPFGLRVSCRSVVVVAARHS